MKLFKVRAEGPDPPGWRAGAREASEASQPGHPFHVITRVRGGAAAIVIAPDREAPDRRAAASGASEASLAGADYCTGYCDWQRFEAEGPDSPGWRAGARGASEASQPGHPFYMITGVRGGAAAIVIAPVGKRQTGGPLRAKRARPAWLVRTTALVIVTAPGSAAAGRVTLT